MFARVIVSETDSMVFDVEALIVGDDELEVVAKTNLKFRELIQKKEDELGNLLSDQEIDDCVADGLYMDDPDNIEYELHVFMPNELVEAKSEKDFDEV